MCFSNFSSKYSLLLKRGLIFSGCQNFNSASGWQMLGHYYVWSTMEGCLSGLVTIYVSSLLNLNEFKCSLLTATARESWGWFSRTRGPQIWLCPAVSEGKQSPLTFQSSNSDKSDVLRLLSHDRSDVDFSYRGCQRVFFAAPCSYVTRSLVRHTVTSSVSPL